MKKTLVALGVVGAMGILATPTAAYAEAGERPLDPAAIERYVTDYAKNSGYPGFSVAITKGDKVLHKGGYGRDGAGKPMTAATAMPVASVSKSFTAMAVMQLVEAKKVNLDSPVREYLPDFTIADPRGAKITVRQLLNQTSGLSDRTFAEKSLPQPNTPEEALRRVRTATLAVDPGTKHIYTNTNSHLAARVVEVVAGESYNDYVRRRILEPIGMSASRMIDVTPRDLPANLTKGHIFAYGAAVPITEPHRFLTGSDGLITSADDMAQWLILHGNGGRAANGTQLVSAESITAMHTSSDPRWTYGMGWDKNAKGHISHTGIWFGHTAGQLLLPSGHGIAVMGNSGIGLGNEGIYNVMEGLATLVEGGTPTVGTPLRLIVDLVLGGLTLLSLALGIRTMRRATRWADKLAGRPMWITLRLAPRFIPLALLVALPTMLGALYGGGRDITHGQLWHYSVALMLWSTVATAMGLGVVATRVTALLRKRRPTPAPDASAQVAAV